VVKFPYFFGRKRIIPGIFSRIFLIPGLLFLAWRDRRRAKGKTSPPQGKSFEDPGHTGFHHDLETLNII
jgi:hypothetical protein